MKKILLLFLFTVQIINAQGAFERANDLYKKAKYQEAIEVYQSIVNAKKHSADIYFNLGNCYYKLNDVAPAIYNFEKALLLNPNDADIQNNLRFAQKLQIDDIKEIPKVGFHKIIQDFTSNYHYDTWAWIAVGFATLFLLLFAGYFYTMNSIFKRLFFSSMILVFVTILMSVAAALFEKSNYNSDQPAIVFAEITSVKTEPKVNAPDSFVLHEGSKVFILETLDNWKKIELTDGKKGWILTSSIKELK
jgi:tetratricopeptide (TPR) repeat protein